MACSLSELGVLKCLANLSQDVLRNEPRAKIDEELLNLKMASKILSNSISSVWDCIMSSVLDQFPLSQPHERYSTKCGVIVQIALACCHPKGLSGLYKTVLIKQKWGV